MEVRPFARVLLPILLLVAGAAAGAEDVPRTEHLYVNSETVLGSTRMVALGGAYVGIAEGADGFSSNLSSLAQRGKDLDQEWALDFALSYVDVPVGNPAARDLDNDGVADAALQSRQLITGLALQYKTFGIGAYTRGSYLAYCLQEPCGPADVMDVQLSNSALAVSAAFHDDEWIGSVGLYSASANFRYQGQTWSYGATSFSVDALFRPHELPFRIGAAFRPALVADFQPAAGQSALLAGRPVFAAVVTPALLSVGASLRLGPGALTFNRLSPIARREALALHGALGFHEPALEPLSWRSLLISSQLDVILPVTGATQLSTLVNGAEPVALGAQTALAPHLGFEHETVPGRLRLRVGSFLEPSPYPGHPPRPHATGGFELLLLHYLDDWSLSSSFDVASRYTQFSVSIGFWR